jgi:hypothetical protein
MGPDLRLWVELRGFEPLAPSMRTRCATGLRYSPKNGCQRSKLSRLLARLRPPSPVTIYPPAKLLSPSASRGWDLHPTSRTSLVRPGPVRSAQAPRAYR